MEYRDLRDFQISLYSSLSLSFPCIWNGVVPYEAVAVGMLDDPFSQAHKYGCCAIISFLVIWII